MSKLIINLIIIMSLIFCKTPHEEMDEDAKEQIRNKRNLECFVETNYEERVLLKVAEQASQVDFIRKNNGYQFSYNDLTYDNSILLNGDVIVNIDECKTPYPKNSEYLLHNNMMTKFHYVLIKRPEELKDKISSIVILRNNEEIKININEFIPVKTKSYKEIYKKKLKNIYSTKGVYNDEEAYEFLYSIR